MTPVLGRLKRALRSLYARIALIYLIGLLLLSAAVAWLAVYQFDQLGREMRQRSQIDLADHLVAIMRAPLAQGVGSKFARRAAGRITAINPALALYVLDANARVVAAYGTRRCGLGKQLDPAPLNRFLSSAPMLPIYMHGPCTGHYRVFSVSRLRYGPDRKQGYLLAILGGASQTSMLNMLRTSSITRTLIVAGGLALLLSGALGLLLFGLLTRRFSRLTQGVGRLAAGDYARRVAPGPDDEIGRLARAFNEMAATLQAQMNALAENDRQRCALIANLSHDFRTPLTSLRGYVHQLRADHALTPEQRRACLDAIRANTERLTRLARQLSTLARVDAFDQPLTLEPFSAAELASDVIGKFRGDAEAAGIDLSLAAPADLGGVRADLGLIDRALTNLVENALAATPAGGRVRVEITAGPAKQTLAVIDTGAGIAADEIALVTQRFYRGRGGRARSTGSGLGLAIAADICQRHGSRLAIDSRPGRGSRFAFDLPVA